MGFLWWMQNRMTVEYQSVISCGLQKIAFNVHIYFTAEAMEDKQEVVVSGLKMMLSEQNNKVCILIDVPTHLEWIYCLKLFWSVMKRNFRQWWSTISPISTKWRITSDLKPLNIKKTTYDIRNPGLGQAQKYKQRMKNLHRFTSTQKNYFSKNEWQHKHWLYNCSVSESY